MKIIAFCSQASAKTFKKFLEVCCGQPTQETPGAALAISYKKTAGCQIPPFLRPFFGFPKRPNREPSRRRRALVRLGALRFWEAISRRG
jgi:hypothetical protein